MTFESANQTTFKNDLTQNYLTQNYKQVSWENASSNKTYYTLAATTGDVYCGSVAETNAREELSAAGQKAAEENNIHVRKRKTWWDGGESNCFRTAQWCDFQYSRAGVRILY